jgi:molecular chaperone DnaK (HSP70)
VSGTPTESSAQHLVGIDLGTTNSALAWSGRSGRIHLFDVPQLAAPGDVVSQPTLPSFLYLTTEAERASGTVSIPWAAAPSTVAGVFAREQGALVPARQIASAKSWLANRAVDRTAPLLPWGADEGPRLSPVEASSRVLDHLCNAWNHAHAGDESARLERQRIVLTVPASFDEEARELTAEAARGAGLTEVVLLEEPLAALYAWIAANRRTMRETLEGEPLVLVCDVGGGTTDFSLFRTRVEDGDLRFERVAIGEHLLLGGDNLDLALATLVEHRVTESGSPRLTLTQRHALARKCSAAKEQLLSNPALEAVRVTLLGSGRGIISGGITTEITYDDALRTLMDGFLPAVRREDVASRDRRAGLREIGLPYESEPAITKHLAAFLTRIERGGVVPIARPDAVLFNGGFFTPAVARDRVLDVLASWFGERPSVLVNEKPEAAVAIGAAFYARLRANPSAARRLLVRAGSPRAYYIGVRSAEAATARAVCVLPRGTQEGTSLPLDRDFVVVTNQPAAFTLYSSLARNDAANEVVVFDRDEDVHRHAPLVTVMRFGKRSRRAELTISLRAVFTETGTLEIWCESRTTDHRWRLSFNLRSTETDPLEAVPEDAAASGVDQAVIGDAALLRAAELLQEAFGPGDATIPPESLIGEIETALGFGKQAWPLAAARRLADVLLSLADGRRRSAAAEARWLNLTGFCTRPGFGADLDPWRVSELRKVYAAGLTFPREIQNQVEWLVLWQRVAGGFSGAQQRELAQRVVGQLGIGQRKPPRLNPQIEREGWRLLGSLERLDAGQRTKLGDALLERLRRDARNVSLLWALSRFGARRPLYGPLNFVVPPAVAERWLERLAEPPALPVAADTIVQIAARTGDPARDIDDDLRARLATRLRDAGASDDELRPLLERTERDQHEAIKVFGESLPEGLRLS